MYTHNISYVLKDKYAFCLRKQINPWTVTKKIVLSLTDFEKTNCFAALMFDERILPYLPQGGNQGFREALAPAGTYAPSFTDTYFINLTLGALRTIAWCIVAGACRPKQLSPPMGFKTYRCVFIKALQSKVFSEILLICVNFLVTAHGSICIPRQNVQLLFRT